MVSNASCSAQSEHPDNFRVVSGCAVKHNVEQNGMLHSGPVITSQLSEGMMRFRNERVAITTDIEKNVYVSEGASS